MEKRQNVHPPLRLWPGVAAVALAWLVKLGLPAVMDGTMAGYIAVMAGAAGGLFAALWWLFFSRAPWLDRLLAIALMFVGILGVTPFLHESVATAGQGMMFNFIALTYLGLAFVVWAVLCHRLPLTPRRLSMAAAILLACGAWALVRTEGVSGSGSIFAWRWSPSAEERLLAESTGQNLASGPLSATTAGQIQWPGFRGPGRDSLVSGNPIDSDWAASPPQEVWRRPVGPGWSSFAVAGGLIYTQEQRGEEEVVAAYRLDSGEPVWMHRDSARFWESNGGAGPRATPTLHGTRVYAMGATGILNVLDSGSGDLIWSRNVAEDTGKEVPYWGLAASPAVTGDLVIAAAAGKLAAYDLNSGEPRWFGPDRGGGYNSPRLVTLEGVPQVLMLSSEGATSLSLAGGEVLWQHPVPGFPIVQPVITANGDILAGADMEGTVRFTASQGADGWTVEEHWFSNRLKPNFSGFVVHGDHAYGFDGNILACIDLAEGKRQWKGGRYGHGQLLLLPNQDLLLVVTERGELALVEAKSDGFNEVARVPALKGKTWNHPVLVDDVLLLRNAKEMLALRLAMKRSGSLGSTP